MSKKRIIRHLYSIEDIRYSRERGHYYFRQPDGTLMYERWKTNIKPEDLPEWYIFGRYYKRFGYLSAKGVVDVKYHPNLWINHFLKDDILFISYSQPIIEVPGAEWIFDRVTGYDENISGNEILEFLKAARHYSNLDIAPIIEQLKFKKKVLQEKHPNEFGPQRWNFDIDKYFAEDD